MLQQVLDFFESFGVWGLAIHSFADAIIFPIPAFFLQVSLSMMNPSSALWLATAGFLACLLGTPFGYLLGKTAGSVILSKLLKKSWMDSARAMFQKNGEMAILIGAFTPIPFKVFTIMSGSLHYPLWRLMIYASIGRAVKFYVVGILFYLYGRTAESMVTEVSAYVGAGAIVLILIGLWVKKKMSRSNSSASSSQSEKSS